PVVAGAVGGQRAQDIVSVWRRPPRNNEDVFKTATRTKMALTSTLLGQSRFDFRFRNGGLETSPLIGRFCGRNVSSLPVVVTHSNQLFLRFHSDSSVSGNGFLMLWNGLLQGKPRCGGLSSCLTWCGGLFSCLAGCGGEISSPEGDIASPNYPGFYDHMGTCVWKVHVDPGSSIVVTMVDMQLGMSFAGGFCPTKLKFHDGPDSTSRVLKELCGSEVPDPFETTGNSLYIRFSNGFFQNGKFHLKYRATIEGPDDKVSEDDVQHLIAQATIPFLEPLKSLVRSNRDGSHNLPILLEDLPLQQVKSFTSLTRKNCNRVIKGSFHGVIQSPNFPREYPHQKNCNWTIQAPMGNRLNLTFSHFHIEGTTGHNCTFDHVKVSSDFAPKHETLDCNGLEPYQCEN
ncbi:unnamed protein product, partial [Cyprideis torosa]